MYRLKTRHSYHDAVVLSVKFDSDECVVFEVELWTCGAVAGAIVHLWFHGVRNMCEVRNFIDNMPERTNELAGVIGFSRDADRRFVLDLDHGPLYIEAKSFLET